MSLLRSLVAVVALAVAAAVALPGMAAASHIPGQPCQGCASHAHWPTIDGKIEKAQRHGRRFTGGPKRDQLMGHHGSDVLKGGPGSDILWGDWDASGQPASQRDRMYGGPGNDFIYGSHGRNAIFGGAGNDAISVHYGRGKVDCGPGRDIYHVARSRRTRYKFRRCEKVDYRSEAQRGGGLKPLRKLARRARRALAY